MFLLAFYIVKDEEKGSTTSKKKSDLSVYGVKQVILSGKAAEALAREQDDRAELAGEKLHNLAPGDYYAKLCQICGTFFLSKLLASFE